MVRGALQHEDLLKLVTPIGTLIGAYRIRS
jgi:hypothetical protein